MSTWSVSNYCARYGKLFEARRFAVMFSDGRSKAKADCHGVRHNTDIGAGARKRLPISHRCANMFKTAEPFVMPGIHRGDVASCIRQLYAWF